MSGPDGQEQQPTRSQAEIQALLRDEIEGLKTLLDARFKEIATLTKLLEAAEDQGATAGELAALRHRSSVEKTLIHVLYRTWHNGPMAQVPDYPRQIEVVRASKLFDATWYLQTYTDLEGAQSPPAEHYAKFGAFEGRDPGPDFDSMQYYLANPDIAAAGWPALVHYELYGREEGRPAAWTPGA